MADNWNGVFQSIQGQGKSPSSGDPKSPTDSYFAYLDKADWDASENLWYLMFDMVPAEAALLGLNSDTGDGMPPPALPTIVLHAHGVTQAAVTETLQLSSGEDPAEGSWYALFLQEGGDPKTQLVGDLYHPDTDFDPKRPSYGQWHVASADLTALPGPSKSATLMTPPPAARRRLQAARAMAKTTPRTYKATRKIGVRKSDRYRPHKKTVPLVFRRVRPPPPPPPGYGALGVMAIGQGGFNLLLARGTREPAFYYDAGYPLGFFLTSVPPQMRVGNALFQGPIMQNAAGNLEVVLSHWDWDHWRFGNYTNGAGQSLGQLHWTVPNQPMSPTAAGWVAGVNTTVVPVGAPPLAGPNGSTIYKMQPPGPAPHAFYVNNSGLALRVAVDLAAQVAAPALLTGDGNFTFLPGAAVAGLYIIGAVHHGSNNHGAAANIPAAPVGTTGRIAYSYGITGGGGHAYGFPDANAVLAYQAPAANWTAPTEQSTAEAALNVGPAARGNIRVGDQGALPGAYAGTAFATIAYPLA